MRFASSPPRGSGSVIDTRHEYFDLARVYLPIAIAVFVAVVLAVALLLARGRAGQGRAAV